MQKIALLLGTNSCRTIEICPPSFLKQLKEKIIIIEFDDNIARENFKNDLNVFLEEGSYRILSDYELEMVNSD